MFIPDPNFFPSRIRIFSIPDPRSKFFPSRIFIKECRYFHPKKLFLSSRIYDPGCSSRIRIPDPAFLPIPYPGSGVKKALYPGSESATLIDWPTDLPYIRCRCGSGSGFSRKRPIHQDSGPDPQFCSISPTFYYMSY
jgi:hypothetical protein